MTLKPRPSWTGAQRLKIFNANEGRCHICTGKIWPDQKWIVEHPKARGLQGSDDIREMKPAHVDCHKPKTAEEIAIMRKADRMGKSLRGIKRRKGPPMAGTRASGIRKRMNGVVERW